MYILVCLPLFHNNTVCIFFKLDHNLNIIFKLKDEEKNIPGSFGMIFCQFFNFQWVIIAIQPYTLIPLLHGLFTNMIIM